MRLSAAEIAGIVAAIDAHLDGAAATLFLYGSRVSDALKGGDIDLLLLCAAAAVPAVRQKKYEILRDIKARIGDQRIDLSVVDLETLQRDAFWRASGAAGRIELHRWAG